MRVKGLGSPPFTAPSFSSLFIELFCLFCANDNQGLIAKKASRFFSILLFVPKMNRGKGDKATHKIENKKFTQLYAEKIFFDVLCKAVFFF
jgi:hypothetical protein